MLVSRILLTALLAAGAPAAPAAPLLFHDHGHGLAFSSDGKALLAPSENGLAVFRNGAWAEDAGPVENFSGFSVTARAIYSSGRASGRNATRKPLGLVKSTDGGKSWQALALAGEADFHWLAAGYRGTSLYVVNAKANSSMPAAGLYRTHDEGKTWQRAAADGLEGEIHSLAVHPSDGAIVALATGRGLYLSRDGGGRFRRLDGRQAATAVVFDHDGRRVRYARALSNEIVESDLDGGKRRALRLPPLRLDYVTCLAQHPTDTRTIAVATRRRDVYLSVDGGASWRRIAEAAERRTDDESERSHEH